MEKRTFAALLLIFVVATGVPPATRAQAPAQDAQAAALLAKHRAYVGWQLGDGTFTSMRINGHLTGEDGKRVSNFVIVSQGVAYQMTTTRLNGAHTQARRGYTGNVFWLADINGFPTPVYGDYAKYLASLTMLRFEGTTGLPATMRDDKTIDGKALKVVRVTLENGDAIDCYVDPDTGAYVQAVIDPGGSYETTFHILSYADIRPGKKMIGSFTVDESKDVEAYDTFEPNVAVSTQDLHPPQPTASWSFDSTTPSPITLTHSRILVDATVNGVKGRFILDTGAGAIILDDRFAARANAEELKTETHFATMYGGVASRLRRVDTISFGSATLHNPLVWSQDFHTNALGTYRGLDFQGYDGIIGYDLFAGTIVRLDLYGAKLTVLDPSTDLSGEQGLQLVLDLSKEIPAVPMTMDHSIPVNALLDTGDPGTIYMARDFAKKHNLVEYAQGCGTIDSLSIGPITYADQRACLARSFSGSYVLVGFDFLKRFDYVFDYPHGRIFLTPNKN